MSEAFSLGGTGAGAMTRDRSLSLFGQTMAYVAATAGLFALGAYAGRHLSESLTWVFFIAAFVCLIAMNFTARRSMGATVALLGAFGVLIGLAMSPLLVYYAVTDPAILWQAGGATALFILGFGTAGYLIRSDLSALARVAFFALLYFSLLAYAERVQPKMFRFVGLSQQRRIENWAALVRIVAKCHRKCANETPRKPSKL